MDEKEKNKDDNKNKKGFFQKIGERTELAEAITDYLKGHSVQDCIDILDSVKRKILSRTIV